MYLRIAKTSQVALVVKNPAASAGDIRSVASIPGLGRSTRVGNSNPLQYLCLENPMDRGAWWAIVQRVAESWTRLKRLSIHTCIYINIWCSINTDPDPPFATDTVVHSFQYSVTLLNNFSVAWDVSDKSNKIIDHFSFK